MKISIISSAKDVTKENTYGKTAIVIDVLRATTVMVTALMNGGNKIFPFKNIEDVLQASKQSDNCILCGERLGLKIDGFHLGNSPLEFTKEIVENKDIFMTTSNGTRAIENAVFAKDLYIACFLNISAIAKKIIELNNDTVIICAGTNDDFSLDDALCAGLILKELKKFININLSDFDLSILRVAQLNLSPEEILQDSKHYSYLKSIGFEEDLKYCLLIDKTDITPKYTDGKIQK